MEGQLKIQLPLCEMWEERNNLQMELLSKKEAELKDLENSQPNIAKKENTCSREDTESVAGHSLYTEMTQAIYQPSLQLPEIEMCLC